MAVLVVQTGVLRETADLRRALAPRTSHIIIMGKKAKNKVETTIERIAPNQAKEYLEKNPRNRNLRKKTVEFLAAQMVADNWQLNGETIIFDARGNLLDGQHRLNACVEAGKPFTTFVVRGIDANAQSSIDTGIARTAGDVLTMNEISNGARLAAAARVIFAIEGIGDGDEVQRVSLSTKVPHNVVLDFVRSNSDILIEGAHTIVKGQGKAILRPPATWCALYYLFASRNRTKAREFFDALTSGEELEKDHPVYRLRSLLISNLAQKNIKRKKLWYCGIAVKAWNAFLRGEQVRGLKFGDTEQWPHIRSRG